MHGASNPPPGLLQQALLSSIGTECLSGCLAGLLAGCLSPQHRERGEPVPPEQSLEVARQVKERHAYVCSDMVREFAKFDDNPAKYFKQYEGAHFR